MVLVMGCLAPRRHPPTLRIQIESRFSSYEHRQFLEALPALRTLGFNPVEVQQDQTHDVVIRYWDNLDPHSKLIGLTTWDTDYVQIASARVASEPQLRAIVLHELGHWLGMNHVCLFPGERPTCSTVGYGVAIMNPEITLDHVQVYTNLDILEFRRVWGRRR